MLISSFACGCGRSGGDGSSASSRSSSPAVSRRALPWSFIVTSDESEDLPDVTASSGTEEAGTPRGRDPDLLSPPEPPEPRRLSVDPDALLEVLNSSNFNKEAIRDFFDRSLGDALPRDETDAPRDEEDKRSLGLYFTKGLRDKTVESGRDFALTVEVSHPDREAGWDLDGMELIPENSDKYTFVSEGRVHVLIVHDACVDDEGDYSCAVSGISTTAFITVQGERYA